ncbi:MAG: type II secretion system protein GspM [Peptococcia bacterium]|jgi:type IV pilus assembly protein PilO
MKINEREKILIMVVAVVVIAVLFFMFLLPPALDNLKALRAKNTELDEEIATIQQNITQDTELKDRYKTLNIKALAFSNKFYNQLAQERIILDLNQLLTESGLNGHNLTFKEQKNTAKVNSTQGKPESLQDLTCMEVSINYGGTFNQFLSFLNQVGEFDKKILIKSADIINSSKRRGENYLAGNMVLEFYAIPSLLKSSMDSLNGDFTGVMGGNDPFSGVSLVDADVMDILLGREKVNICDFVLTVKPITADLPTIVLGLDDDISADSFVCADNSGVEDAKLHLFMKDEQYLCKYQVGEESYPRNSEGVEIPFVSGEREIVMKVFSNPRTSATDLSGVNLSLHNETDKPLVVKVINDDSERPRVNIVEQAGYIEIE